MNIPPRLIALGSLRLQIEKDAVELPAKAKALILYLAFQQGTPCARSEVATLLWPDVDIGSARHSLSQALYVIRRRVADDFVRASRQAIWIETISADFVDFQREVTERRWGAAASLYGGSLANGAIPTGSVDFEHWLDSKRAEFKRLAEHVANQLTADEAWGDALALADVLLKEGVPSAPVARVKTLALLATAGEGAAVRFAERLGGHAADEAERALASSGALGLQQRPATDREVFVGRHEGMKWLQRNFEEAVSKQAILTLVEGEAGSGKTALVKRFSRLMTLRGARVLSATGYQAEQNIPFGVVGQWIQDLAMEELEPILGHPWMSAVGHFFPRVGGLAGIEDNSDLGQIGHQRLLESLRRLIAKVFENRSLIAVIDDIHFADPASLSFVHYLLRHSNETRLLLVATSRTDSGGGRIDVRNWNNVSTLTLPALSPLEISEYLQRTSGGRSGGTDPQVINHLHRQTGGNPLLLSILVREGSHDQGVDAKAPKSIVEFLRPRLLEKSLVARRLLAAMAILSEACDLTVLGEMVDAEMDEIRVAVDELLTANLIVVENANIRLRHGLVGEVALSLQGEPARQRLHGRTTRLLEQSGTRPSPLLAQSHDLAGNQREAYEASMRASVACDVLHARSEKEFFLRLAHGNAPSTEARAEVQVELAELYLRQRQLARALELLDVDVVPDGAHRIRQHMEVLKIRVLAEMTGDPDALRQLWTEARKTADELSPLFVADTYTHIGGVAWDLGLDDLAAEVTELVIDRLSTLPQSEETALRLLRPTAAIGVLRGYRGALEKLEALPKPLGHGPVYGATFRYAKATLLVAAGQLPEAEALFATSLGITERYALFDHIHAINNNLGVCLLEQGKFGEAQMHFKQAQKHAAAMSPSQHSTSHDNLTILAYERGDFDEALASAADLIGSRKVSGGRAAMSLFAIMGLSALEVGHLARCRQAETELRALMDRYGGYSNDMSYAHIFLARMVAIRGEEAVAVDSLKKAAEHFRGRNFLARARTDVERCRLLLKTGTDCSALLDDILSDLQGSGAVPLIERAEGLKTRAELHRA